VDQDLRPSPYSSTTGEASSTPTSARFVGGKDERNGLVDPSFRHFLAVDGDRPLAALALVLAGRSGSGQLWSK